MPACVGWLVVITRTAEAAVPAILPEKVAKSTNVIKSLSLE